MDKIKHYRELIKQILTEHAEIRINTDTVNSELIIDSENDHYQLAYVGWQGDKRVFGPVMHFDIQNGKITMGGELRLVVEFPNRPPVTLLGISEIEESEEVAT